MSVTTYTWAMVALPDPESYYYGYKEARVLEWGEINRSLSDDRGNYEGADFSFLVSDTDRLVRNLLAGNASRYGMVNRNLTVRMISDAGRRALLIPRTIARGLLNKVVPLPELKARFEAVDFVTSQFSGANTDKLVPQRLLGPDFLGAPLESTKLAAPLIYGQVSDEASASQPPVLTGDPALGGFVDIGGNWSAGYGPLTSSAAPVTGVNASAAAGGTLSEDVPNSEYGVIVTAVDSIGRESNATPYIYAGVYDGRGSFATGPITGVSVDGTKKIQVSWNASVGASKYRVYLSWFYYGARWTQYIEVTAPTTSCEFTANPAWQDAVTPSNITPGANTIPFGQFYWYVVMARMSDGLTGISQTVFGSSGPYRRPLRVQWLAVAGAIEYIVARRGVGDFDRQWTVGAGQLYFDDDLLDTGVTFLTGGLTQPRGAVPVIPIGEKTDDNGAVWSGFVISGHAIVKAVPFLDGLKVNAGNFGVTWLVPGQTGYTTYFSAAGTLGRYMDFNGRRYAILWVRGPDAEAIKNGKQVTVNVDGIEPAGNGSGAVITNLIDQYLHFIVNFGFQDYASGAYLSAPTWAPDAPTLSQIDEDSFDTATAVAAVRVAGGYVGAGVIGNKGVQEPLREWMARFNLSANVDSGFNRNSQFFIAMLDDRFTGTATALRFTQLQDVLKGSFSETPQRDKHFNIHPYVYRRRWREDTWEVENVDKRDQTSIDGYRAELTAEETALWFVRDSITADDVMQRRLLLAKDPPSLVVFETALTGFNTELGDVIFVTHNDAVVATPFVCQIRRHALDPNTFKIRMECLSVQRIFETAFIFGDDTWGVTWTTASATQKQYGFLCDETTGQFSDGAPGDRLR